MIIILHDYSPLPKLHTCSHQDLGLIICHGGRKHDGQIVYKCLDEPSKITNPSTLESFFTLDYETLTCMIKDTLILEKIQRQATKFYMTRDYKSHLC